MTQTSALSEEEALVFAPPVEVRNDPYPHFKRLRERMPVYVGPSGSCILSRHSDCERVLQDHQHFSSDRPYARGYRRSLLFQDPPDHTRLRSLVSKAFTPRVVSSLRPHVEATVGSMLDNVDDKGSMDLVADLADPLPNIVIAELLGVPVEDWPVFREWGTRMGGTLDPRPSMKVAVAAGRAFEKFDEYFTGLIEQRRAEPRSDLLTALVRAETDEGRLTHKEIVMTCSLLLIAGHDTTMNLIANGTLSLLRHPDELERLRADGELLRVAIEELLRFDSPIQLSFRTALAEVDIDGTTVTPGQEIILLLASANRDPARFEDPDRFDIARWPNPHLSLGSGIHFCLGAPLARMEARAALAALIHRFPDLRLEAEPQWRETVNLRGPRALRLAF
jgi:cytochrome P450